MLPQVGEQLRRLGPVFAEPRLFLFHARQRVEHPLGDLAVPVQGALARDPESPHMDPVVERLPCWKLVAPADVIRGAGGEDGHVVVGRQPPRHGAAVPLGPSGDRGAEAVDHARELQRRVQFAAEPCVLDRELLDAGGQQPVHPLLPPEVVAVVIDQPAYQRQQQPPLDEHDRRADDRSMTGKSEARVEAPLLVVGQQFRQEDGALAALDGASEHLVDGGEELGIAVGHGAVRDEALAAIAARGRLDFFHQLLDRHVLYFRGS